jgi:hypothetical protein
MTQGINNNRFEIKLKKSQPKRAKNNQTDNNIKNAKAFLSDEVKIYKEINKAKQDFANAFTKFEPLSSYINTLLHRDMPPVLTPLTPIKAHLRRSKFQHELIVNASGALAVLIPFKFLSQQDFNSTVTTSMYMNQAAYNPSSDAQVGLVGGWTTQLTDSSGLGLDVTLFGRRRIASAHVQVSMTGVNNYDKKGTIHIAEDWNTTIRAGSSTDTADNEFFLNDYSIADLPKMVNYKVIDIVNMSSDTLIQYNYIPETNQNLISQYVAYNSSGIYGSGTNIEPFKVFAFIVSGAAVGTTFRFNYQIDVECEVDVDYVNSFPIQYSKIFHNSEPLIRLLSQNVDNVISLSTKSSSPVFQLYKDMDEINTVNRANNKTHKYV